MAFNQARCKKTGLTFNSLKVAVALGHCKILKVTVNLVGKRIKNRHVMIDGTPNGLTMLVLK